MPANATDFTLLILVKMATNQTRIFALTFAHSVYMNVRHMGSESYGSFYLAFTERLLSSEIQRALFLMKSIQSNERESEYPLLIRLKAIAEYRGEHAPKLSVCNRDRARLEQDQIRITGSVCKHALLV